ncbi:MAG TPA: hypothetical protein DEA50_01735 [Parvularcula sp.]|nr:hypothetical protein [Parvularcula sp.]
MRALILVFTALLFGNGRAVAESCPAPPDVILAPVNIVDVERGAVRKNRGLVLSKGQIAEEFDAARASRVARLRPGTARIDGEGAFVLPGLFDMHVHALWDASAPAPFFAQFLAYGVTSVRDMGGDSKTAIAVRGQMARCEINAPTIWFPGPFLDGPQPVDPELSIALETPEQARAAVSDLAARSVDFIKAYSLLSANVLDAVVVAADEQGLRVAGHVPAAAGVTDAVLKFASIEHPAIEIGGFCPSSQREACAAVFQDMIAAGVAQTPTLVARETSTRIASPTFKEEPAVERLPEVVRAYWRREQKKGAARATDEWRAARRQSLAHARWMTGELSRLGAILLAGSDAGNPYVEPGVSLHEELALLVAAGLSEREALEAATSTPAKFMMRPDLGRIAPGASADLVLLRRNPLQRIENTRTIIATFKGGLYIAPPATE